MADVFVWNKSGTQHSDPVNALREEIIRAHASSSDFPIALIFTLLPVISPQTQDASDRGSLTISGDSFENTATYPLTMDFDDPTMGAFYATIPAVAKGTVTVSGNQ